MRLTRHLTPVVVLLIGLVASSSTDAAHSQDYPPSAASFGEGEIRFSNETGELRQSGAIAEVVEWAAGRYQLAGLSLPDATIEFDRLRSPCGGLVGYYRWAIGRHWIHICVGGTRRRRLTVVHELAHAWAQDHLDDDLRQSFLTRREIEHWSDPDDPWASRGTEQAAMIITWGLDERCETPRDLIADDYRSLGADFIHLTGVHPICTTG